MAKLMCGYFQASNFLCCNGGLGGFDGKAGRATGFDLLGGLGDFNAISGANTAFNELANLADLGAALEQDGATTIHEGAFNLFGGNLFGPN